MILLGFGAVKNLFYVLISFLFYCLIFVYKGWMFFYFVLVIFHVLQVLKKCIANP